MNRLLLDGVSKRYRSGVQALSNVSLDIGPGVLGLLGPNGAGKSTLMRIAATVMGPSSGSVSYNDISIASQPDALRRVLGYLPQDAGAYPNLSAREFLRYIAALKGMSGGAADRRISELLEQLNLSSAANRAVGGYSGGMKQRVGIAQALLNDPQVVIVDEPTVGLDPEERARFRDLVAGIAGDRIVILSTHIVSDVESLAERVVMIAAGTIIADGRPDELAIGLQGQTWEGLIAFDALDGLRQLVTVTSAVRRRDGVHVRVASAQAPSGFSATVPTLEEAYLVKVREARAA